MTSSADKHKKEERQHIDLIADKLIKQHPSLPAETVNQTVDDAYQRFNDQPIRDFVPLLVERKAHEMLGDQTTTATPESLDDIN
ncbi:three-helix bundle dimerization domain-containing protein [Williamsia sp.]|uniref:three-helix bundle dimerization domain-containing protein n=1 Tax=Williamsia sp. TaxID=1872085 RepID=UPI002F947892